MNSPEYRIPEDKAQEVFTLAAQLYAQHNQSYSVNELIEAGAEARIPPEFVQQAIEQLEITQTQQSVPVRQTQQAKYLIALAIGLPLLAAIAVAGWLLARNTATTAQVQPEPIQQPIAGESPVAANPVTDSFKCENINFEGQDLRNENFRNADCDNGKLAGVTLSGVDIESANLSGADLRNANLKGANLKNANLTGADLTDADLSDTNLEDANLSKAQLTGAILSNAKLRQTNLAEANLEGANLDVRGAKAERVNFNNATLPDGTKHP